MSEQTKLGLKILGVALLLGILGDAIMRSSPWGLNVPVWTITFSIAAFALGQQRVEMLRGGGARLLLPTILFSTAFVWRDSPVLRALSCLAILVVLTMVLIRAQGVRIRLAGVTDYVLGGILAAVNVFLGPLSVAIGHVQWGEVLGRPSSRRPFAVVRGTLLALPLLLLFGTLLSASDVVFATIVRRVLDISSVVKLLAHLPLVVLIGWTVAGYLRGLFIGKECPNLIGRATPAPRLNRIDMGVMLGSLDFLFLLFVVVQLRYLFGGASLVTIKPGLTYAEYARSGFFELVAVAALALPVLLAVGWLLRREHHKDERFFRLLALAQVLLLFVIMASAVERMALYQREFGQTELRFYTTAFMGWLGLVFVWFLATVLRGQRERFAFGALAAGLATIAFLYALNPDGLIARTNLARAARRSSFDAAYLGSLSADAVPTLIAGLPSLGATDRCKVATTILRNGMVSQSADWRTWNWSRRKAQKWLAKYQALLDGFAQNGPCSSSG